MPFDEKTAREAGKASSRKGIPNKATKKTKAFLIDFLQDDQEKAMKDWDELEPKDRWNIRSRLYDYITPKMSRTDMHLDVSKLSDEEVDQLLSRALEMAQENTDNEE